MTDGRDRRGRASRAAGAEKTRPARVLLLYAGGTAGMVRREPDDPDSPLVPGNLEHLRAALPDVERLGVDVELVPLLDGNHRPVDPIDSSDVEPEHWLWMARAVERGYDEADGFVILHGTDTMAYTSSALSFLLDNLAKPVVVTGAQLPLGTPGSNAPSNVLGAIRLAGWRATGVPLVPEVVVAFGGSVFRGNRVRKVSSTDPQAFDSPNAERLGTFSRRGVRIETERVRPVPGPGRRLTVASSLAARVADLAVHPGLTGADLGAALARVRGGGAILRTYGAGGVPSRPAGGRGRGSVVAAIERAVRAGTVVTQVSQCWHGGVEPGTYAVGEALPAVGVACGHDMTPEAALTKLMVLRGQGSAAEVTARMEVDLRGELSA